MKLKRSMHDASDSDMNDSIDNMNNDDIFLPAAMQPHVTINESPRFDTPTTVKREGSVDVVNSRPQSPMYRNTYSEFFFLLKFVNHFQKIHLFSQIILMLYKITSFLTIRIFKQMICQLTTTVEVAIMAA